MSKKYLSPVEAEKLLSTPYNDVRGNRDRLFLRLLLGSGLRRAEALALTPNDLNMVEGVLTVQHGKGDKMRVVPMDRHLIKDLLDYALYWHIEKEHRIFPFSPTWASQMVRKYGERAGLKGVHTHTLRHTYAIASINAGRALNTVQHDLGHKSLHTTSKYLEITAGDRQRDHINRPLPWETKQEEG